VHPDGIGNSSGFVGRCFQEHPFIDAGIMVTRNALFAERYEADLSKPVIPVVTLRRDALNRHKILQYYCRFHALSTAPEVRAALRRLWSKRNEPFDSEALELASTVASNMGGVITQLYAEAQGTAIRQFRLEHRIEQAPNLESRALLSDRLDALGLPQLDLHWSLNDLDLRTFEVGRSTMVRELSAAGLARFISEPLSLEHLHARVKGRRHHIGTTRMSEDAATGVVDKDLKVHEVTNLYVAGSSVFPRGGLPGPTLLIVALARRLALHLRERMRSL
jgi:choline dehydrogenase-like flavoprotein